MVYQSNGMMLRTVKEVFLNDDNIVRICEDMNNAPNSYYTVIILKNHILAKRFLEITESNNDKPSKCYIDVFSCEEGLGIVADYVKERNLLDFYMGKELTLEACETVCINLIIECISTKMPYPVLYLALKQRQIQLERDNNVMLSMPYDFSELDSEIGEEECVVLAAEILRDLLESKSEEKAISYELLSKKVVKESYDTFKDLYFDIKMAAKKPEKRGFFRRIRAFFSRNSSRIFKLLLRISIFLAVLAIIAIVCRIITGEIPFLRLFVNTFKRIGTESLIR